MSEYIINIGDANRQRKELLDIDAEACFGYPLGEEIVRCCDCKHYTEDDMEYYHYCGNWCGQVEPDGFCTWGERAER